MECEQNCVNEQRIKNIEQEIKELRGKNEQTYEDFCERIQKLKEKNIGLEGDIRYIKKALDEANQNIKTIMAMPSRRYENIVACVISALVSGIIAFILRGILPM